MFFEDWVARFFEQMNVKMLDALHHLAEVVHLHCLLDFC